MGKLRRWMPWAFLFCALLAPPCPFVLDALPLLAAGEEARKDQIEKIEIDLSREREQFLKFNERERDLLEQLAELEKGIAEKRKMLGELEERLKESRKDLVGLRAKQAQTEKARRQIEARLIGRLVAFYKFARKGTIQVLVSANDLDDLGKRVYYLRSVMGADQRLFEETMALQKRHREEIQQVQDTLASIERMDKEESQRMLSLREDLDRKVLLLVKIHKEREFYETAVKELESAAKRLKETLVTLDRKDSAQKDLPTDFASAKGLLPLPTPGRIIKAQAPLGTESEAKGVVIKANPGAEVKAVFPGRVEFSGPLRGYGEVVVINHGSRFFTVTAYLKQRRQEEGRMVKAGEVIGLLAKDGSGSGTNLYFEIRQSGSNLDPQEWLKVR